MFPTMLTNMISNIFTNMITDMRGLRLNAFQLFDAFVRNMFVEMPATMSVNMQVIR